MSEPALHVSPGPASPPANPFKFLDHFGEKDAHTFAGREHEVSEVVARIVAGRAMVLYGRSGLGKTSLLQAGVFPELVRRGWVPVYARLREQPLTDVLRSLEAHGLGVQAREGDSLHEVLRSRPSDGMWVLVFDQFEELFTRFREQAATRKAFMRQVAQVVADRTLEVHVVFSLREDYLAELDEFVHEIPELQENRYRLRALSAFGARQAIARPLLDSGLRFDRRLLVRLVNELSAFDFDPTVLQIICTEVYRQARKRTPEGPPELALRDLEGLGGVQGIFETYLKEVTAQIPERLELLARLILDTLITAERTRRPVTVELLLKADFSALREDVQEVLDILVHQRLLRPSGEWYELVHERLVDLVIGWLELDRTFFRFRRTRQLITHDEEEGAWKEDPDTFLIHLPQLTGLVRPNQDQLRLNDSQTEFVVRSLIYRSPRALKDGEAADPYRSDLRHWAKRIGPERTLELVSTLLEDADAKVRLGAATAARALSDPDGLTAAGLLRHALDDSDPAVRRSAGESFATLAAEDPVDRHDQVLLEALGDRHRRKRAVEVLALLHEAGRVPKSIGQLRRRQARKLATRKKLDARSPQIHRRARDGGLYGALGILVWWLAVGNSVLYLIDGATRSSFNPEWIGLGVAMLFGALFGWGVAGGVAREAALRPVPSWFRGLLRSRTYLLMCLFAGGMITLEANWNKWPLFGVATLTFGALIALALAGLVGFCRPSLWPDVSARDRWLWSLIWSLAWSLPVSAVLYFLGQDLPDSLAIGQLLGVCVFIPCLAVATSAANSPIEKPPSSPPPGRRRTRGLALGAVLVSAPVFLFGLGTDTLPFLAPWLGGYDPGDDGPLTGTLGPISPDADYYQLHFDKELLILRIPPPTGSVQLVFGNESHPRSYLVAPGRYPLTVQSLSTEKWKTANYKFNLGEFLTEETDLKKSYQGSQLDGMALSRHALTRLNPSSCWRGSVEIASDDQSRLAALGFIALYNPENDQLPDEQQLTVAGDTLKTGMEWLPHNGHIALPALISQTYARENAWVVELSDENPKTEVEVTLCIASDPELPVSDPFLPESVTAVTAAKLVTPEEGAEIYGNLAKDRPENALEAARLSLKAADLVEDRTYRWNAILFLLRGEEIDQALNEFDKLTSLEGDVRVKTEVAYELLRKNRTTPAERIVQNLPDDRWTKLDLEAWVAAQSGDEKAAIDACIRLASRGHASWSWSTRYCRARSDEKELLKAAETPVTLAPHGPTLPQPASRSTGSHG